MNVSQIFIENIAVGLNNAYSLETLDLKNNEYLVVGEKNRNTENTLDTEYNTIITNKGLGINASRRDMQNTSAGLFVSDDIICKGTLIANSLKLNDITLESNVTSQKLTELIQSVNSNLIFFRGYSNDLVNVYTPSHLTIGSYTDTYCNSHALNIVENGNGTVDNIQFVIQNNIMNDNNETSKFAFGCLGYSQYSPANIITTQGMSLEFHISKNSQYINNLYSNGDGIPHYTDSNYPSLAIDSNGCVNINKNISSEIIYNSTLIKPVLNVNGAAIIKDIYMQDSFSGSNLHLDGIYLKKNGLTLNANQIRGGDFVAANFSFNSNVNIGNNSSNNLCKLNVYGSATITESLNTNNLLAYNTIIDGKANFNDDVIFNKNVFFNNGETSFDTIKTDNIMLGNTRITTSNIYLANNSVNYDGSNLDLSGRLRVGILNTDTPPNHQFNIIKRNDINKTKFEIYVEDISPFTNESSIVYMGHTALNNLNSSIDNSFVILTQKNRLWHNIYFYAGKNVEDIKIKKLIPTLAIMQNNKVGINNNLPEKTFDVNGEIIATDYFIRKNNINYKTNSLYYYDDNTTILNGSNININLNLTKIYINKKTLNISGSINSYDGYYEGDYKIATFKEYPTKISATYNNIGIGVTNSCNIYEVPLQIRNTSTQNNNNSIIRIFRGVIGGGTNNNSLYSGIDFCDYDMPYKAQNKNNYKWFIYKNNVNTNNIGPLQIGYTNNTYNPTHSCINFYYNDIYNKYHIDINNPIVDYKYNSNVAVSIKGNVEIEGNINLKGTDNFYMINGAIVGTFSNINVNNITTNITTDDINREKNDIAMIGNKIILLPLKSTIIGYNDGILINKIIPSDTKTPLIIYNKYDYDYDTLPIITKFYNKAYKYFPSRSDNAIIELGIISTDDIEYNHKVNFHLKGFSNSSVFEITPNDNNPFFSCIIENNKNQIIFGNKSKYSYDNGGNTIDSNICVHINDTSDCLLKFTNDVKPIKIILTNDVNIWEINSSSNFNFNYKNTNLLNIANNGICTFNPINTLTNTSTININSISNKPSIEITNYYTNEDDNITKGNAIINVPFKNLEYDFIDNNKFIYKINDSNLPTIDKNSNLIVNYYVSNIDLHYNSNINLTFNNTISNISLDYRYIKEPEILDGYIKFIPKFITNDINVSAEVNSFNNSLKENTVNINSINYTVYTKYLLPKTINNEITLNNTINSVIHNESASLTNGIECYNVIITTDVVFANNSYNNPISTLTYSNITYYIRNDAEIPIYQLIITNFIKYDPIPNINVDSILISINYNYQDNIIVSIPQEIYDINYTGTNTITPIINNEVLITSEYNFLKHTINNSFSAVPLLNYNNTIKTDLIYPISINNIYFNNFTLIINKNNNFQTYSVGNNDVKNNLIEFNVILNDYKPHLILKNHINSKTYESHKIFSYDNKYEIYTDNRRLISLENNGNIKTSEDTSLYLKDIYLTGQIYYGSNDSNPLSSFFPDYNNGSISNLNINRLDTIVLASKKINLNPNIINGGGIAINNSTFSEINNLFEINNYNSNDNFITLNSVSTSGFINFNTQGSLYKFGINSNSFGIWRKQDYNYNSYVNNSLENYNNLISFTDLNNSNFINLNCDIKTSNNLNINGVIAYANDGINDANYKFRVFGNIKVDGDVITTSDKRIKSDIKTIENALDKIDKLTGITYKNDLLTANKRYSGLIAQEVNEVLPEVVYEDEKGYLNIAYGNLTGLIIEAIKELRKEIKELKNN